MKRLLATTLLSLACCAANAEWKSFATDTEFEVLIEDTSIKIKGSVASLWVKYVFKTDRTMSGHAYRSSAHYQTFQCEDGETKITYSTYYPSADVLGADARSINSVNALWRPIMPNTYDALLKAWACR